MTRRANKEEIEIQKIFMELPKIGITIVSFFATASALILRFSATAETTSAAPKIIFFLGVLVTLYMFNTSYIFMTKVVANVIELCDDDDRDLGFEDLQNKKYPRLKTSIMLTVFIWVGILGYLVVFT